MGFERTAPRTQNATLRASMYFAYGRDRRNGVRSATTFEAILAGERTSTTRFPVWPGHERWTRLTPGDRVRFYADRDMRGKFVDVVVEQISEIDLAHCSELELEEWSKAEGWSTAAGRGFGRRYGRGLQIRYVLAPTGAG